MVNAIYKKKQSKKLTFTSNLVNSSQNLLNDQEAPTIKTSKSPSILTVLAMLVYINRLTILKIETVSV